MQNCTPLQGNFQSLDTKLSVVSVMLLKGIRVVIPQSHRRVMLVSIHQGHLGRSICKERARQLMFWPKMLRDSDLFVAECSTCKNFAYQQPRKPLIMCKVSPHLWFHVGIDLFGYGGNSYLLAFDAYSNYPEAKRLQDTFSETVILTLSSWFARHGIPAEVNGPQFSSYEFQSFSRVRSFKTSTT